MTSSIARPPRSLPTFVAEQLRARILRHEWQPGERIPGETSLAEEYQVSRATVRTAVRSLEDQGLVRVRQGLGTFVTPFGQEIRAGLQELRSMTRTIAEQGHEPGMEYRTRQLRPATAHEADQLDLAAGDELLYLERALSADGQVVAFVYDIMRPDVLSPGLDPDDIDGSIFDLLADHGSLPDKAIAEVAPVVDRRVGWGPGRSAKGLYLKLEQTQFLPSGAPMSHSTMYFVEDRFRFSIVRRR